MPLSWVILMFSYGVLHLQYMAGATNDDRTRQHGIVNILTPGTNDEALSRRVAAKYAASKQARSSIAACDSHQFRCGNGKCVDVARRCDGHQHCDDDEVRP